MSIAATKLKNGVGEANCLLVIDSLTSPYLFNRSEIIRFTRLFLSKFAAQGNAVLAIFDEGCGDSQDLIALQSISNAILRMSTSKGSRLIQIVKHPKLPLEQYREQLEKKETLRAVFELNPGETKKYVKTQFSGRDAYRPGVGDYLHPIWPNLAHWSGMLWDPENFSRMVYDLNKEEGSILKEGISFFPLQFRLFFNSLFFLQSKNILLSRKFSSVEDAKKAARFGLFYQRGGDMDRCARIEYLPEQSKKDEHHFRVIDNSDCCGFERIGTCMASHIPPAMAGAAIAFEQAERDWNAIETKCIGLGDPHCEVKLVPGEIPGLYESLVKGNQTIEHILERMFEQIMGLILENKPLPGRPKLGDLVYMHVAFHQMGFPHLAGERYQMAQRMGGAKTGRELGDRLLNAGLEPDQALRKVIDFMNICKVGLVEAGNSIIIHHNIESLRTKFWTEIDQPCCYFTTGFLNGLYRSLKGQRVREIRCQAVGDAYCEWLVE